MEDSNENYVPSKQILKKYADVLVNFALNDGEGVKKGENVFIAVNECARPILDYIYVAVIKAGANPIVSLVPDGLTKKMFIHGSEEQISFYPQKLLEGRIEQIDHQIGIIGEHDLKELSDVEPKKIIAYQKAMKPYMQLRNDKENRGEFTWTLGIYGTYAMAKEAGMSLDEYWEEIINACYLDKENPVLEWKNIQEQMQDTMNKLNELKIDKVHIEAEGTDLWIKIGDKRKWVGATGRNIPSYEIFTSPDWRETQGYIEFSEPLYRYGNIIKGIRLEFENGVITKATASEGEELLKEMIATQGADKIGEFSLTDSRISRITKFMANTLYDENVGGRYGNTHIAVGQSYADTYDGDATKSTKNDWEELGFNDSAIHTDIVSTTNRKVTAYLKDGSEKVIFEEGKFVL
jgi:aminopeptidase